MTDTIQSIDIDKIEVPDKYRRERTEGSSKDDTLLVESIRNTGLRIPITLKESGRGFILIDGARRLAALKRCRASVALSRVIRAEDKRDPDLLRYQLNVQRENLKPFDEAKLIRDLCAEESLTQSEAATILGKKRSTINRYFDILKVGGKWQKLINDRVITIPDAQPVAALTHKGQRHLYDSMKRRGLPFTGTSIRNAAQAISPVKNPELFNNAKQVAGQRISEKVGRPFEMKRVEGVARQKAVTDHWVKLTKRMEDEITAAIPVVQKIMSTKEVFEVLPTRSKNAFAEFAGEYLREGKGGS
jgi:ParB/RepB/Spo0J family partition protein